MENNFLQCCIGFYHTTTQISHNYVYLSLSLLLPLPLTILIVMCLGVCLFGIILFGIFWASWIWISVFFPILGKCSSTFSSFNFSGSFSLSSPSRSPIMWILLHLMQSQMSHHVSSHFKILSSFCCCVWVSYIFLSSSSQIHSSTSSILLLNPSNLFFSSVITTVW